MTIEEKAKAYDEAIKKAKLKLDCCDSDSMATKNTVYYIFSELEKSEDERIRKELIDYINRLTATPNNIDRYNSWIDWLEKQGEQKQQDKEYTFKSIPRLLDMIEPSKKAKFYCQKLIDTLTKEGYNTDANIVGYCLKMMNGEKVAMATMDEEKQSPKFKVGDWITNSIETVQITGYDIDYGYQVDCKGNLQHRDTDIIEKEYHLWSIADAKSGDVLAFEPINGFPSPFIVLYKGLYENGPEYFYSYCFVSHFGDFCIDNNTHNSKNIHPATKEQRKLLFEKIAEAGYGWDDKKKELKITAFNKHLKYNPKAPSIIEQKPAWSEEDEKMVNDIIASIDTLYYHGMVKWLKSLKDRVQPQLKQKWTEEDENGFGDTLWAINKARTIAKDENDMGNLWYAEDWLKGLKERIGG